MNPTQSVFCNAVLQAPPGVSIEECTPLAIKRTEYECGHKSITSYWRPTAEELKILNANGLVSIEMLTPEHPMIILGVVEK
jgi:hypothetical protein